MRYQRLLTGGAIALILALLLVVGFGSTAQAQGGEPVLAPGPGAFTVYVDPAQATADDGGAWELGVEGTAGNLMQATAAERYGMWYWLNGWFVRNFSYGEATAWEEDFKRAAMGGTENSYLDSVDLMFYVGHGSPGRFTFHNNTHDDGTLQAPIDCSASWGDGDNEWLALTSCQVLADSGLGAMAQCMNRQHLILGFVSNASAHNNYWDTQAYHFGRYLRYGYNMTQSWFNACDIAQRGRIARVIAEETNCFNDNPYFSSVCADSVDNDYYWYTHYCGTESATAVPLETLAGELPVFQVAPYSLDEATADYRHLGAVFSVPVTPTLQAAGLLEDVPQPPAPGASDFLVAEGDGSMLQMDQQSGLFQYTDLNALWNDQAAQAAIAAASGVLPANVTAIDSDAAVGIADAFLNQNGLMSGDASFYEVVGDSTGTLAKGVVSAATVAENETTSNWQVIYSRKLAADVPVLSASGEAATAVITFTVVGPGAKMKVYVPTTVDSNPTAASTLADNVIGAQGGWREIQPLVDAASGEQVMTAILDEATAQALFEMLDDEVTMGTLPMDIESIQVLSATLAYWESVAGASQGQLIPVYEFSVRITEAGTGLVTDDLMYVPASPQYMRPLARILDAPALPVAAESSVTLHAADPSKTLAANGIGTFDFALGFLGVDGTYLTQWYSGIQAEENKIPGCTNTLACTFTLESPEPGKDATQVVMLVVTDTDSPNQSEGVAAATIQIGPTNYLPLIDGQE